MATVAGQGCAPRGIPFSNPQARDAVRSRLAACPASGEASELGYVDQLERRSPCAPPLPRCSACNEVALSRHPSRLGYRHVLTSRASGSALRSTGGHQVAPGRRRARGSGRAWSAKGRQPSRAPSDRAGDPRRMSAAGPRQRRRRGQRPAPVARAAAGPDPRQPASQYSARSAHGVSPARVRANARASRSRRISMQDNAARGASDQRQVEHQRPAPPRARD